MNPTVTPTELRAHAATAVSRLGHEPATARERVRWRERRDAAAAEIAKRASDDPVVIGQATALAAADGDRDTQALLHEASGWVPRR